MNTLFSNIRKSGFALLFLAVCGTGSITSCTDYLDKSEESDISAVDAFKDYRNFQGFVEELYACVPDFARGYWTNSWNWGEDEIMNVNCNYHMCYKIDQGDFWGWQSEFDGWQSGWMDRNAFDPISNGHDDGDARFKVNLWKGAWYGIRKANMGLANIDEYFKGTKEERDIIEGQLYFFRGWFHFELIQFFGGMPYIDRVLPAGEAFREPRLSYQECADKCADDFRKAADLLPVDWDATAPGRLTMGKNQLRVHKLAALGYLGKNYLFAASPLMKNTDAKMNSNTNASTYDYDKEYAKKAADALGELLSLVEPASSKFGLLPFENYSDNFYTYGANGRLPGALADGSKTEALFRCISLGGNTWQASRYGVALQFGTSINNPGSIFNYPTANYVNYYGMANGLPLDAEGSGFDKTHPWKDRDPRFYNDIKYDGCRVIKKDDSELEKRFANLQTGGNFRTCDQGSRTGYMLYKFIDLTCNETDDGYGWSPQLYIKVPYMRLADAYLMYAEALAAIGGATAKSNTCGLSAVEAVNKIRERAGVADVDARFTGDANKFMDEVRRERAVELSYEGHRFNDLRRWLLLDKAPYNVKTSQEFLRVGEINPEADPKEYAVSNFREEQILKRDFSTKHYWLPLKKGDCELYEEYFQNPGW